MITGNEPIHHITGADGVPFNKSETDKDIVYNHIFSGLTIRQHFAAMAMQGLCANTETIRVLRNISAEGRYKSIAETAVMAADALINELNKSNP